MKDGIVFVFLGLRLALLYADERIKQPDDVVDGISDSGCCSFVCHAIRNVFPMFIPLLKKWNDLILTLLTDVCLAFAVSSVCSVAYRESQYKQSTVFRLMLCSPILLLVRLLDGTQNRCSVLSLALVLFSMSFLWRGRIYRAWIAYLSAIILNISVVYLTPLFLVYVVKVINLRSENKNSIPVMRVTFFTVSAMLVTIASALFLQYDNAEEITDVFANIMSKINIGRIAGGVVFIGYVIVC